MNASSLLLVAALRQPRGVQRIAAEQLNTAAVPEPQTWALVGGGLVFVAGRRRPVRLRR